MSETPQTDYERFKASSPENAALLDAEERVLAAEKRAAKAKEWLDSTHTIDPQFMAVREAIRAVLAEQDRLKAGMDRCDLAQHRHHEALLAERDALQAKYKRLEWAVYEAVYETRTVYGPGRFVEMAEVVREIERRAALAPAEEE